MMKKIIQMIRIQKEYDLDMVVGSRFLRKNLLLGYQRNETLYQNLQIG